jgi:hypothetical protein
MNDQLTLADLDFAYWLGTRRPGKRERMRLPAAEVRKRAYDDETDQQLMLIRGMCAAEERMTA